MSRFKDAVKADVKSVFLNLDEFADMHDINGSSIRCVVDVDEVGEAASQFVGVFNNTVTVYVAAGDMTPPVEGEIFRLDGSLHEVRRVNVEGDMIVIVAEANVQ